MNAALAIIGITFATAIALGIFARRGHTMSLEQWSVGGRGFGALFVFLLMAGEIYTTFTFLGGSGWAYGRGAPAYYILCYGTIAYSLSYFMLPAIWRYAKQHRLVSQADFFAHRYESRALGVTVAVVSVVAMVPYLVLQMKGLGLIVSEASYGSVSPAQAVWGSSAALVAYVTISGVRGSAWTAAVKDVMILAVAVGLGIYLPVHYYGGYGAMFAAIDTAKPGFLALPASGMSPSWFVSTVMLTALGFYMWPHSFGSIYTAKNEQVFRKNAIVLPLYQLVLLFVFFVGFAAVLQVPGLRGADADLSLLRIAKQTFAPWMVGVIGAAGLLTALVPGSMLLISAATVLGQNIFRLVVPTADDRATSRAARSFVPLIALVAVVLTLFGGGQAIVTLLLLGYSLVTQLFPALILGLSARWRPTAAAALAGIIAGELTVGVLAWRGATIATLAPSWPQPIKDLNTGVVALAMNVLILGGVAALTRRRG